MEQELCLSKTESKLQLGGEEMGGGLRKGRTGRERIGLHRDGTRMQRPWQCGSVDSESRQLWRSRKLGGEEQGQLRQSVPPWLKDASGAGRFSCSGLAHL